MKNYLFEMLFAAALIAVFLAVSAWQSTGKLAKTEVARYMENLEQQVPADLENRSEILTRLRVWAENDDGKPIYMLNLMRYYDQLRSVPGGPATGTPEQVNTRYEKKALPMLLTRGGYPLLKGNTTKIGNGGGQASNLLVFNSDNDNWDKVLFVRYPGRRAFLDLVSDSDFLKIMPEKLASVEVMLTPVYGELVIPDLRWTIGGGLICLFLLVGWIRAARRQHW